MPAYFYHLAFELQNRSEEHSHRNDSNPTSQRAFLPPKSFNIFQSELPVHRSSSWASYIAPRRGSRSIHRNTQSFRSASISQCDTSERFSGSEQWGHIGITGDTTPEIKTIGGDWRAASITVESIDMESNQTRNAHVPNGEAEKHLGEDGSPIRGKYVPRNPRSTDLGYGVVHLYRDEDPSPVLKDPSDSPNLRQDDMADDAYVDNDCTTLCILAVPSYMIPSDFLSWVKEDTWERVSHFRLIRTGRSNRYMVLMKFRDPKDAKCWQQEWTGKLFSALEVSMR